MPNIPGNPLQMFMSRTPLREMIVGMQNLKGGNPMQIVSRMAGNNQMVAQGLSMMNGKSPAQVEQIARNMAQQRGVDVDDLIRQMGLR